LQLRQVRDLAVDEIEDVATSIITKASMNLPNPRARPPPR